MTAAEYFRRPLYERQVIVQGPLSMEVLWVGRTVPSFRVALDTEMARWRGYRRCLRPDEREIFDRMMDACRIYASASGVVVRTNPLRAMFVSVLLEHQRKLEALEKLNADV